MKQLNRILLTANRNNKQLNTKNGTALFENCRTKFIVFVTVGNNGFWIVYNGPFFSQRQWLTHTQTHIHTPQHNSFPFSIVFRFYFYVYRHFIFTFFYTFSIVHRLFCVTLCNCCRMQINRLLIGHFRFKFNVFSSFFSFSLYVCSNLKGINDGTCLCNRITS